MWNDQPPYKVRWDEVRVEGPKHLHLALCEECGRAREFLHGDPARYPEVVAMVTYDLIPTEVPYGDPPAPPTSINPKAYHYLHDVLGSVIGLVDEDGDLVERYTYDPYGQPFIEKWDAAANGGQGEFVASETECGTGVPACGRMPYSSFGNPFLWTGHRYDAAVGLYYAPERSYSPVLGRWLQRDPIDYVDGVNLYEYVQSAPLFWIDPFGLEAWHHMFPQEHFRDVIPGLDIDAPEHGWMLDEKDHSKLHGRWNEEWGDRIDKRRSNKKPLTKRWAQSQLKQMQDMDEFKATLGKGKRANDRYHGSYVNGPPAWKARRAARIKSLGPSALGLLSFLGQGKGVIDSFGKEGSPCYEFANQLSQGKVSYAQCMECYYHLLENVSHSNALQFEKNVCVKLPKDGNYALPSYALPNYSCPGSGGASP